MFSTTSGIVIRVILRKLDYALGDSRNNCVIPRPSLSAAKVSSRCCSARPAAGWRARACPEVYDTLMFCGYLAFCLPCIADRAFVDWSITYRFVNKERTDPSRDLYAQRIMYGRRPT